MAKRFFVYMLFDGVVPIYVGKGQAKRHLVSQRRHGGVARIIEWFDRERSALAYEKKLIAKLKPQCNRTKGGEGRSRIPSMERRIERGWYRAAYARENSGYWLDKLVALAYRKCEENQLLGQ